MFWCIFSLLFRTTQGSEEVGIQYYMVMMHARSSKTTFKAHILYMDGNRILRSDWLRDSDPSLTPQQITEDASRFKLWGQVDDGRIYFIG